MSKTFLNTAEVAEAVVQMAIKKTKTKSLKIFVLGIMGGIFIALGFIAYITVTQSLGANVDPGLSKLLGAAVFPVGLMLVLFVGGSLFTGNNLAFIAYITGDSSFKDVLRNWIVVWLGNFVGSAFLAWVAIVAGVFKSAPMAAKVVAIAEGKVHLGFAQAVASGFLCNVVVALAIWMTFAATDVTGKLWICWFPIMMFALSGYQHVVANMFVITAGWMVSPETISISNMFMNNYIPVTIGNVLSGGIFVPVIYYWLYLKKETSKVAASVN
ncbi:formate/nitrite transporter family protein [Psychrilyobacter atlanticus]|uniref:formate/nitrite transporter family protein n=1 Tax=Psychrilyobacter atlanticus TaxID=271091 RepID=UPI00041BB334|nr:formate/nitrite transporter family protein [Psychrilyobacter atlanticus]